jgi:uncharacterized protein with HEPN domain
MSKRDYQDALVDLEHNLKLTIEFTESNTFSDFEADYRTQYAVIRALEICGEAAKQIPDEVRDLEPGIPFKAMAGMRDRLIHGYDNINTNLVWTTAITTVPAILPLLQALRSHIAASNEDSSSDPDEPGTE